MCITYLSTFVVRPMTVIKWLRYELPLLYLKRFSIPVVILSLQLCSCKFRDKVKPNASFWKTGFLSLLMVKILILLKRLLTNVYKIALLFTNLGGIVPACLMVTVFWKEWSIFNQMSCYQLVSTNEIALMFVGFP